MTVDLQPQSVESAIVWAQKQLGVAGIDGARAEARLLLRHATGLSAERQVAAPETTLDGRQTSSLAQAVTRRSRGEPIAHILGRREFWSLDFVVTPDTLDPRPDSETVIAAALARLDSRERPYQILDLGTGTGCLLLALMSELPNATGVGVDIAPETAHVARLNAARLGFADRTRFVVGDWTIPIGGQFDVILCNPPYVRTGDIDGLSREVAMFEPRRALDGGADGLDAFRALGPGLRRITGTTGFVVVEVGAGQAEAVSGILTEAGFADLSRTADLAGIERCISAKPAKNSDRG